MWNVLHFLQEHWIITVIVIVALISSYIIIRDIQNAPIESNPKLHTLALFGGVMGYWKISYYYLINNASDVNKHEVYLISVHLVKDETCKVTLNTRDFLPLLTEDEQMQLERIIYLEHTNKPNPLIKV